MLALAPELLAAHLSHTFFIMVRVGVLLFVAPIFSEKVISKRLRAGLALLIALLIAPSVPESQVSLMSWSAVWLLVKQAMIGAALGLTLQLLFAAVRLCGEIVGMQMGLSFATFFDPNSGNTPVISRFLNLLAMLLFLSVNGHLWLLALLAESFVTLPVNADPLHAGGLLNVVSLAGIIFSQGLIMGLPIITLLLCINMALGLLNRLTPQLSIFVVGFPLTLGVGMLALFLIADTLPPFFMRLMASMFAEMEQLLVALW
ncbi:flagellar biosynthetic protein FliR [Pantoea rwandensis]|uniref:Flagellar biosynthetic protein FliR n=1 Tax=Pantoea rwandensis TaxID=1076550 RepID=A0A1X1D136_9GAMM|nr:flagellar biosynthetic protein FliR [Pantoea rwandensis]ORM70422.1 flagellar biosynthetic protein FliR [Pantoea rwandensis]